MHVGIEQREFAVYGCCIHIHSGARARARDSKRHAAGGHDIKNALREPAPGEESRNGRGDFPIVVGTGDGFVDARSQMADMR